MVSIKLPVRLVGSDDVNGIVLAKLVERMRSLESVRSPNIVKEEEAVGKGVWIKPPSSRSLPEGASRSDEVDAVNEPEVSITTEADTISVVDVYAGVVYAVGTSLSSRDVLLVTISADWIEVAPDVLVNRVNEGVYRGMVGTVVEEDDCVNTG